MNKVKIFLSLIRIKHWIKNILIFVPLVFNSQLCNIQLFLKTLCGFFSFCLISSSIYIFNDIKDIEQDRRHKVNKKRPLAAGKIGISQAKILQVLLLILGLVLTIYLQNKYLVIYAIIYIFLNILYSIGLKNIPILDIAILCSGFIIRMQYGATITSIEISKWLFLTIISSSFFMVLGKRRNEMEIQGKDSRNVLCYYTKEYLDKFMYVSLTLTIVFYSLWSIDISTILRFGNNYLVYTTPLVFVIFMKYCLNVEKSLYGDPVDLLISDKILLGLVFIFILIILVLIYIL